MAIAPIVTVITVCYNSANSLEQALKSVTIQDWPNVEHIVIDGGSTDDTLNILGRYKFFLSHVVSERDEGIYDAMNKGLDRATGDIVCFLNADDQYASSHVLSRIAQQMQEHQLDAMLGDVAFFHATDPTRTVRRYRSDRFTPERLAWGWMPAHPALFLNKSVVQRVGRFKTDYRIAGDFDYIARAFYGHDLRYQHLPEVLVQMQTGGASTAGWRSKMLLNKEVLRACRENGIDTNILKILSKYPLKLLELVYK
jgi:glycosyltransferase involved in cell wall biosynthesis